MQRSAISVVIPVYNRSHSIGRALDSVLAQSCAPLEIVIVDDGSTDDLAGALAVFEDRIRLLTHETNEGAAAARNTGVQAAAGNFVAFLDSDDSWHKKKLEKQVAFMARLGIDASCTGFTLVSGDVEREAWRPYPDTLALGDFVWGCYTSPGSTLVARRDALLDIGGYDTRFARYEDWDLMLRLAPLCSGGIGFLKETLTTVYLGANAKADDLHASLDLLLSTHHDALRAQDLRLSRRLRSSVAFNRASAFAGQGQWVAVGSELIRCVALAPFGNWPLRVILAGRLSGR